jgi:hypothetical protein
MEKNRSWRIQEYLHDEFVRRAAFKTKTADGKKRILEKPRIVS